MLPEAYSITGYVAGINKAFDELSERLEYSETERHRLLDVIAEKDEKVDELSQQVGQLKDKVTFLAKKGSEKDTKIGEQARRIQELEAGIDDANDAKTLVQPVEFFRTPEWYEWNSERVTEFMRFTTLQLGMFARAANIHYATIQGWIDKRHTPSRRKGTAFTEFAKRMNFKTHIPVPSQEPESEPTPVLALAAKPRPNLTLVPQTQPWTRLRLRNFQDRYRLKRGAVATILSCSNDIVKAWEIGKREIPSDTAEKLDAAEKIMSDMVRNREPINPQRVRFLLREAI